MPELPEVQTIVTTLQPLVQGRRIRDVRLLRDDIVHPRGFDLRAALTGRSIASIARRGKRIVFSVGRTGQGSTQFFIHLGMTGRLTIEADAAPIEKHTHLIVTLLPGRAQLRFRDARRFGGIFWIGSDSRAADLGPEPLEIRSIELAARLARTKRAIKSALLDQKLIAGLGNIYVDEALFAARVHPLARSDKLRGEQVRRLHGAIRTVLRRAIRHRGSTLRDYVDANGDGGAFQRLHRVYDREGDPCSNCRAPIRRIVLGGRSTHFCAHCQRHR